MRPGCCFHSAGRPGPAPRSFTSWSQEHVWAPPALCALEAPLSVLPSAASLLWGLGVTAWGRGTPRVGPVAASTSVTLPGRQENPLPRPGACGGPGALRLGGRGWLVSRPIHSCLRPATPSRVPCCWESRRWPQAGGRAAQTTASPQWRAVVGDSSTNGPGCGWGRVGAGPTGRGPDAPCRLPGSRVPRGWYRRGSGTLGVCGDGMWRCV